MDKKFIETAVFFGKIGADNALLLILGAEHIILFVMKWQESRQYKRIWLYLYEGLFFIGYGFFNDIYRFKVFRPWLLQTSANFVHINSFAILLFGVPLLIKLTLDIQALILERRKTRYVRKHKED